MYVQEDVLGHVLDLVGRHEPLYHADDVVPVGQEERTKRCAIAGLRSCDELLVAAHTRPRVGNGPDGLKQAFWQKRCTGRRTYHECAPAPVLRSGCGSFKGSGPSLP